MRQHSSSRSKASSYTFLVENVRRSYAKIEVLHGDWNGEPQHAHLLLATMYLRPQPFPSFSCLVTLRFGLAYDQHLVVQTQDFFNASRFRGSLVVSKQAIIRVQHVHFYMREKHTSTAFLYIVQLYHHRDRTPLYFAVNKAADIILLAARKQNNLINRHHK